MSFQGAVPASSIPTKSPYRGHNTENRTEFYISYFLLKYDSKLRGESVLSLKIQATAHCGEADLLIG